ncbi:uncharacterized protein RHO25_009147 [Cercospora beticola]|uniref:BRCT domain-containing protein n=1 Tax=Cercospora beticola TaxID=122368 RepID=A0ABZ0NYC4_CERBT|nr:hypothetical protein RHO25_009147 [Cercospora beticola]
MWKHRERAYNAQPKDKQEKVGNHTSLPQLSPECIYGADAPPERAPPRMGWCEQHFRGHKPSPMRYTAATTYWGHKERTTKAHIKYLSTQQTEEPWPDQVQRTILEPSWISDAKRKVPRGVTVRERGGGWENARQDADNTLASDEAPLPPTKRRRTIGPDADAGSLPQAVVETSMRLPFERNGRVDNSEVPRICSDDTEEDWGVPWQGPPLVRFKRRGVTHALGQHHDQTTSVC